MIIPAITLIQPWATLVVIGAKRVETRGRNTGHRGLLAIQAAKKFPPNCRYLCGVEPFRSALAEAGVQRWQDLVPTLRCVLGTVRVVDTFQFDGTNLPPEPERSFGNYGRLRWGYRLAEPRRLKEPMVARGCQAVPWPWTVDGPLLYADGSRIGQVTLARPVTRYHVDGQMALFGR